MTELDAKNKIKEIKSLRKKEIKTVKENSKEQIIQIKKKYSKDPELFQAKLDKKRLHKEAIKTRRAEEALIPKRYTIGEEIFNSVSHGVGAGLSIAALIIMIIQAALHSAPGKTAIGVTSVCIFGFCLLVLYLMSTLYHALTPYHVKNVFQIFDHSSIYLLISGSYTPFCLYGIGGVMGWILFSIVWAMAILGIVIYSTMGNKMRLFSAITYIIMGWTVVFFFPVLWKTIPMISIIFLISGGAAYTLGCPFYMLKKKRWTHSIFHLFCVVGSILHFFAALFLFQN